MSDGKEEKDHLTIVIVGHVDSGKSTTTGHLLLKCGAVDTRTMEGLQKEAEAMGKGSFGYAFLTDNNKEERERGITQNINTKQFHTSTKHYTLIDAPGHRDFVKNMMMGTSQADVALLMVPAAGFEEAIAKEDAKTGKVEGQTRQHANICKQIGVDQMIVGVNKMDAVNYSQEKYDEIKAEVSRMLVDAGYKPDRVPFIPMSGFTGENLDVKSEKMPWYKGYNIKFKTGSAQGHTLLDALDNVARVPPRQLDAPVLATVTGILSGIKGVGNVVTSCIKRGRLTKGDNVRFWPSGAKGTVFNIEMHHTSHNNAIQGDNVGLVVKGIDKKAGNFPKKGDVLMVDDPSKYPDHWGRVTRIKAMVMLQSHSGTIKAASDEGKGGFTPQVYVGTGHVPGKLNKVYSILDKATKEFIPATNNVLKKNQTAEVEIVPQMPFYCTTFKTSKALGRIAGIDSNKLKLLGKILEVDYELPDKK